MLKLNNKGSALVWVLTICIIFSLLGVAIGWIALSMNNRSVNNNLKQQTYFTARSAVDAVFEQLNGDPTENASTKYLQDNLLFGDKHEVIINDMGFEDSMGKCSLKGNYNPDKKEVTLTATAKKGDMEDTVTLTAKPTKAGANWPNKRYGRDLENGTSLGGTLTDEERKKGKVSFVYCLNKTDTDPRTLTFDNNIKTDAIFIYVKENTTLKIKSIEKWDKVKPDVFIYLEKGAELSFNVGDSGSTVFPFYVNTLAGHTGSKITNSNKNTLTVYNYSGNLEIEDTIKKDSSKEIPGSGYSAIGTPTEGKIEGIKVATWEKIKYSAEVKSEK
ncbi:MAG: hypothetical protein RR335_04245 [Eubacterium sp.]